MLLSTNENALPLGSSPCKKQVSTRMDAEGSPKKTPDALTAAALLEIGVDFEEGRITNFIQANSIVLNSDLNLIRPVQGRYDNLDTTVAEVALVRTDLQSRI